MTKHITFDPNIMGGQACIRGMRIPVATVITLVAFGMSSEEMLRHYPDLEPEDIHQALQYAATLVIEDHGVRVHRLPILPDTTDPSAHH